MTLAIETADAATLGRTRVDEAGSKLRVATGIDADGFFALLGERLARL